MAQYTKQQIHLIHTVLLRPLKDGEHFKVSNPLTRNNTASPMKNFEGEWVTVTKSKQDFDGDYGYFNHVYASLQIPIMVYNIGEDIFNESGVQYAWYDYHMDIYATNLRILKSDRANVPLLKQEPQMPNL